MLSNPWFTGDSSSLMIYDFLGRVWAVESTRTRDSSSLLILTPYGMSVLSNPRFTCGSNSLLIYDSLGPVWAVESTRHP